MGTMLSARCSACGYAAGPLMAGGGMRDFHERDSTPAPCFTCRRVVTVNLLAEGPTRCPDCGGEVEPYWARREEDPTPHAAARGYPCPACGGADTLAFSEEGCWD